MFHYYTLEEVYEFAASVGYSREEVKIERVAVEYDFELEQDVAWEYVVSFGDEYGESWEWSFEDLSKPAVDYLHEVCED